MEAIDRTHFDAIGVLAVDAVVGDDVGHGHGSVTNTPSTLRRCTLRGIDVRH
jgi:hypothetical protein